MDSRDEELLRKTIAESEGIRANVLFYGEDLDLDRFRQIVRECLVCSVEEIDGQDEFTETQWNAIISRAERGCLLVTTEGKGGKLLKDRVRNGVNGLCYRDDDRSPFVLLAAKVCAPSKLDGYIVSKFGIRRELR